MSDSFRLGKYRYGDGGNIFSCDFPTTICEVVADIKVEASISRRAKWALSNLRSIPKGIVALSKHTLAPADDHAHHLVIVDSPAQDTPGMTIVTHTGTCRICGGVDVWTTGEPLGGYW